MPTLGNRLLREVIDRIGVEEASRKLNLPPTSLAEYKAGLRPIADPLLLKIIDLMESLPKKD